ncbi:MAG TPA: hypothetical protein VHF51_02240 [Solirubrobacteraceae bacterium]|jgi:hypothetical protein|nr:hypothetical protein [Solirubrobacteraceae bacterium]
MLFSVDMTGAPHDEPAQRRVAARQALLRYLNDCMRRGGGIDIAFRCECGRLGCNTLIALSPDQYGAVRAHRRRFALVPGHEVVELEHVLERHEDYVVVEAHAPPAVEIAERTAPHPE